MTPATPFNCYRKPDALPRRQPSSDADRGVRSTRLGCRSSYRLPVPGGGNWYWPRDHLLPCVDTRAWTTADPGSRGCTPRGPRTDPTWRYQPRPRPTAVSRMERNHARLTLQPCCCQGVAAAAAHDWPTARGACTMACPLSETKQNG